MTQVLRQGSISGQLPPLGTAAEARPPRLRTVHRAAADLRRGIPVLLTGDKPLVILGAETAGPNGLSELALLTSEAPVLLLAPARAAAVLRRPVEQEAPAVALRLSEGLVEPEVLRWLADPTVAGSTTLPQLEPTQAPTLAGSALILAKLARLLPAVLAAPLRSDGKEEAERLGIFSVLSADLIGYPAAAATELRQIASARVPLENAHDSRVIAFRTEGSAIEHLAIVVGHPETSDAPLVRIHSECFTGDLLGSLRCDCGSQLRGAIARMADEGSGILLYLSQEGRNIGLVNKLRAYTLQDRGLDTLDANRALGWEADERNFLIAAKMLETLGVRRIRLLTNNPDKLTALAACGIDVVGREAHSFAPNGVNDHYLATKAERFGHLLD